MTKRGGESHDRTRADTEREERLEQEATAMLVRSIHSMGRGEYPFYSASYLRRMSRRETQMVTENAVMHTPPLPPVSLVWQLARRARLNSLETDLVRMVVEGATAGAAADCLGISRRRACRMLRRVIEKLRQQAAAVEETFQQQLAAVMAQEQDRRAVGQERHCRPGQEACRKTGLCTRRWYLR